MQIFKSVIGFLLRLIVVDSVVLVATWLENLGRGIRVQLDPYTQIVKLTGIKSFKDIEEIINENSDEVFKCYKDIKKDIKTMISPLKKEVAHLQTEMNQINKDFYEEDTNVVDGHFKQEYAQ